MATSPAIATIRRADREDWDEIWEIVREVIATGDTYAFAPESDRASMEAYWFARETWAYVAEIEGAIAATYILKPNQPGLGGHVANAAFMVGKRDRGQGLGRLLGEHALATAKQLGYRAMQFNFVVSTNEAAVRLWQSLGFAIVGRVPEAFHHQQLGFVDVFVMHRSL